MEIFFFPLVLFIKRLKLLRREATGLICVPNSLASLKISYGFYAGYRDQLLNYYEHAIIIVLKELNKN